MSWKNRQLGGTRSVFLNAALTLTSTPVSGSAAAPSAQTVGLIQGFKLSDWVSTGEVWRPLGINVHATTTITVTNPVATLQKAPLALTQTFVSAATGGVATIPLQVAPGSAYAPFTGGTATSTNVAPYTFAAADAAGDSWRVSIGTSPSAGAANLQLHYVLIDVAGISDAVTTL
jgi:hypothetical protein